MQDKLQHSSVCLTFGFTVFSGLWDLLLEVQFFIFVLIKMFMAFPKVWRYTFWVHDLTAALCPRHCVNTSFVFSLLHITFSLGLRCVRTEKCGPNRFTASAFILKPDDTEEQEIHWDHCVFLCVFSWLDIVCLPVGSSSWTHNNYKTSDYKTGGEESLGSPIHRLLFETLNISASYFLRCRCRRSSTLLLLMNTTLFGFTVTLYQLNWEISFL